MNNKRMTPHEIKETDNKLSSILRTENRNIRRYFCNIAELHTGIKKENISTIDDNAFHTCIKRILAKTSDWSKQRIDRIKEEIKQFSNAISNKRFNTVRELRDILENKYEKSESDNEFIAVCELLGNIYSIKFKSASLFMRLLTLDFGLIEFNAEETLPPLDRVNYRMLKRIYGEEETNNKLLIKEKKTDKEKETGQFMKEQQIKFFEWGKELFPECPALLDNLWFFGHFYHDSNEDKLRAYSLLEYPYLKNIKLNEESPLKELIKYPILR